MHKFATQMNNYAKSKRLQIIERIISEESVFRRMGFCNDLKRRG